MTLAELRAALDNANVRAFLRVIRAGESGQTDAAYTVVNGGSHFTAPPWAHPWPDGTPTTQGGKAAGAYQFLPSTWKRVANQLGLPDFSPESQDLGAVYLIHGRGALPAVMAGNLALACDQLAQEWVSLPHMGLQRVQTIFTQYGGGDTQPAAPIEDRSRPFNPEQEAPQEGQPMFPLLIPLASALIQAFAPLAREKISAEMNRHTTDKTIGDQIATSVIEAAKSFTGKADPIEAVAAAKVDPAIVAKVEQATLAKLDEIAPFLDKIASFESGAWAASEDSMDRAAARSANSGGPDFGAILVWWAVGAGTVILLGLFGLAAIYAFKGMSLPEMVLTLIVQTVTGILGFVALIFAYRFGTSRSSGAKDELVAQLASRRQEQ